MYWVYALKSRQRKFIYVGMTSCLERRMHQHHSGLSKTTKPYRPLDVIYSCFYETRQDARQNEKYLKSGAGKEWLKNFVGG